MTRDGDAIRVGPGSFDAIDRSAHGDRRRGGAGPQLALWRAPTDNDRGIADNKREGQSDSERWAEVGLDRLHPRVVSVDVTDDALEVETVVASSPLDVRVRVVERWSTDGEALRLDVALTPEGPWTSGWARAGLELALPWAPDAIAWDGYGPGQRYPDTGQSQRLGTFAVDGAAALHTDYVKPQENGSRSGVVSLSVGRAGRGFSVTGDGFAFTASPWSSTELDAAAHPTDLPPAGDRTRLVLDLAEHGIGTASCGPGVLPQYRLDARRSRRPVSPRSQPRLRPSPRAASEPARAGPDAAQRLRGSEAQRLRASGDPGRRRAVRLEDLRVVVRGRAPTVGHRPLRAAPGEGPAGLHGPAEGDVLGGLGNDDRLREHLRRDRLHGRVERRAADQQQPLGDEAPAVPPRRGRRRARTAAPPRRRAPGSPASWRRGSSPSRDAVASGRFGVRSPSKYGTSTSPPEQRRRGECQPPELVVVDTEELRDRRRGSAPRSASRRAGGTRPTRRRSPRRCRTRRASGSG